MAEIYLAGGCFWGMEKYLASIRGVVSTEVGYANGKTSNPTYEDVCHKNTGHAETVRVNYDPDVISLRFLLQLYFEAIDPTSVNRQGGCGRPVSHRDLLHRFSRSAGHPRGHRTAAEDAPSTCGRRSQTPGELLARGGIPSKVSGQEPGATATSAGTSSSELPGP